MKKANIPSYTSQIGEKVCQPGVEKKKKLKVNSFPLSPPQVVICYSFSGLSYISSCSLRKHKISLMKIK